MEQLNRLEIRGNVGSVNIHPVGDRRVAHFSVATNFAYKDRSGEPVIETTWHNVTAWENNRGIPNLDLIVRGAAVYCCGRLRTQKYNAADGTEKTSTELLATTVDILDAPTPAAANT